jgi:hypothetical protein
MTSEKLSPGPRRRRSCDVGLEPDVDVALGAALALVERQGCGDGVEGGGSDGDAGHGKHLMPRPR